MARKDYKGKFLVDHPLCCFCGGQTQSETIDHFPTRAFFDKRQWPEGYEFPACKKCNDITRDAELVITALSRVHEQDGSTSNNADVRKALKGLNNNRPDIVKEMMPNPIQQAKYPTALNIGPKVDKEIKLFGHKLGLALYYFHTGRIVPEKGGISIPRWYSNAEQLEGKVPRFIGQQVYLERQKIDLSDQFNYEYTADEEKNMAVFVTSFRFSFLIPIIATEDEKTLSSEMQQYFEKPFNHSQV